MSDKNKEKPETTNDETPRGVMNYYKCPECSYKWANEWDSEVDDDCSDCHLRHISPYKSE